MTWGELHKDEIKPLIERDGTFMIRKEDGKILRCSTGCNKCEFYSCDNSFCTSKMMSKMLEEV